MSTSATPSASNSSASPTGKSAPVGLSTVLNPGNPHHDKLKIKTIIDKFFTYVVPAAVSVLLVIWLFHKVDVKQMMHVIKTECDFWWIALMMVITTLSHVIRGIRWGIQLRGAGLPRVPVMTESVSIFGAYALNLVFPRLGEAWRCVFMAKREKAPLSTVIGTDIGDRSSDAVVVMALLGLALIVAHKYMEKFLVHYSFGRHLDHYVHNFWLWFGIVVGITVMWAICHFFRRYRLIKKIDGDFSNIWNGFKVLFTMNGKVMYVILTLGIWTCYYLETYVCFFAFPFTRALIHDPGSAYGLIPGLVVFVFGSFSMAVPSNGGLGPWNLAVMFALSLYGISDTEGTAFSMVMWSCQAAMLVMLGIYSACYIMATNRKLKKQGTPLPKTD